MSDLQKIILSAMKLCGWILNPRHQCHQVIRISDLQKIAMSPDYTPWPLCFMNKESKLYAINFKTLEELRAAIFEASEIVDGNPSDPYCCKTNPFYHKSDEEILMLIDIGKLPST